MKGLEKENIRLFYNGRAMSDEKTIGNYNYIAGSVIQAMIRLPDWLKEVLSLSLYQSFIILIKQLKIIKLYFCFTLYIYCLNWINAHDEWAG